MRNRDHCLCPDENFNEYNVVIDPLIIKIKLKI